MSRILSTEPETTQTMMNPNNNSPYLERVTVPYLAKPFPFMVPFYVGYPTLEGIAEVVGPRALFGNSVGQTMINPPSRACNAPPLVRRYKGVRKRSCGRFTAEIRDSVARCRRLIGLFDTAEEAALAYDAAARRLRGSKAKTNFRANVICARPVAAAESSTASSACKSKVASLNLNEKKCEEVTSLAHLLSSEFDNDDGLNLDLSLKIGA